MGTSELSSRQIGQHDVRALLHVIEDDGAAVGRHVEVADHELAAKVGELALAARSANVRAFLPSSFIT